MGPIAESFPRGLGCPIGRRTHLRLQIVPASAGVLLLRLCSDLPSYELLPPGLGRLLLSRGLSSSSGGLRTTIGSEDPAFGAPT